jgi:hypothetical protein
MQAGISVNTIDLWQRSMRGISVVSQKFIEEQPQILRLTTPRLKSTPGAPFAQDDSNFRATYF